MHGNEDAGKVQGGGQDGPGGDEAVAKARVLHHEEGRRAHDGRHDLAAGRGGGLHRAGKFRPVAVLLHHGDGDGAGGNGIAHRGAGDHAAQSGGDHGHLRRAAAGAASDGVCQLNKELGNACPLQERAEDNKEDDEGGAGTDGGADDAFGGVKQVVDIQG